MGFVSGPHTEVEVFARRKLSTIEAWTKLQAELTAAITKYQKAGNKFVTISDFDISQNDCPADAFQELFALLSSPSVRVLRLKFFGCPTMTDEVASQLADYLRQVTPETAPLELHLSDCALTTAGFTSLASAISENDAFPCDNPKTKKKSPLYMRLENNYIEDWALQEMVDSGCIKVFVKRGNQSIQSLTGEHKILLLQQKEGIKNFQQKTGEPPAPEDKSWATVKGKEVFEAWKQTKGQGKGGRWSGNVDNLSEEDLVWVLSEMLGSGDWNDTSSNDTWKGGQKRPSNWLPDDVWLAQKMQRTMATGQATGVQKISAQGKGSTPQGKGVVQKLAPGQVAGNLIKPASLLKPAQGKGFAPQVKGFASTLQGQASASKVGAPITQATKPLFGKTAQVEKQSPTLATKITPNAQKFVAASAKARAGAVKPVGVVKQGVAGADTKASVSTPLSSSKTKLPHPWEEQFSEEYKIPYYWNPVTCESSWEIPTK